MISIDKEKVASRFGRNVKTYDEEAFIQKKITEHLYEVLLLEENTFFSAFEIGCGSGFLTKKIYPHIQNEYIVNDLDRLCTHQLLKENPHLQFLGGDIEKTIIPSEKDLILSSSALQWIQDIPQLLTRIHTALKPNGYFAFSTFGKDNFLEIKALLNQGLQYYSLEEWLKMLHDAGFTTIKNWEWKEECLFDNGTAVLKHIKQTGVSGSATSSKVWNRKRLFQFNQEYATHFLKDDKVRLTYHPLFFILKKEI